MKKESILHLITAAKNASPFDVNMAYDAGYDKIMPYTQVTLSEVTGLTQDAIFSRSPSGVKREAIFIGGRDIDLAIQMLEVAQQGMFEPFVCAIFADPSGAFTTAAAMLAKIEFHLKKQFNADLTGKALTVFGANGPVGSCAAIIAAQQGALVQLVARQSIAELTQKVRAWNIKYQVNMQVLDGSTEAAKQTVLANSDIVICAAAAGVQVISQAHLTFAKQLKVLADVNVVSPLGAEGVAVDSDGLAIAGSSAYGIGALAIGQLKYLTQHQMLKQMLAAEKPQLLEFMAAFKFARALLQVA
ncbi:MAG: methylenetetrahydromethanopterin dehydrogenase [Methylotenera sp.]|nr:methylenetetrahydromethanopterin dehydrogenase [Methylotenera sp.]MSP99350.1 methylenetetrahydromethanopterin dehydrogenase [Methylotenera sp.]